MRLYRFVTLVVTSTMLVTLAAAPASADDATTVVDCESSFVGCSDAVQESVDAGFAPPVWADVSTDMVEAEISLTRMGEDGGGRGIRCQYGTSMSYAMQGGDRAGEVDFYFSTYQSCSEPMRAIRVQSELMYDPGSYSAPYQVFYARTHSCSTCSAEYTGDFYDCLSSCRGYWYAHGTTLIAVPYETAGKWSFDPAKCHWTTTSQTAIECDSYSRGVQIG